MPTVIYDGTFAGPTSAGTAGNTTAVADVAAVGTAGAWADVAGSLYHVDSSGNLISPGGALSAWLTRPTGEATRDQSIEVYFTYSGSSVQVGVVLKRVGTSGYLYLLNTGPGGTVPNQLHLYPMVAGNNVGGGAVSGYSAPTWTSGHNYRVKLKAVGTGPVTLSYAITDVTASAVVASGSSTDTNASISADGTCAVADWSVMSGTLAASRVVINNESVALTAGTPSVSASTATSITVGWPAAGGGTAPYSYALYRHASAPFTPPGTGTLVGTTSSLSRVDSSPGTADVFYRLVVTDSASATALSAQSADQACLVARVLPSGGSPWKIGFVGDSITALSGTAPAMVSALAALQPGRTVTLAANAASGGTNSNQWLIGGTLLPGAIASFTSAGVTHASVMLGTNDAYGTATTPTAYAANMTSIAASLVSAGFVVILHAPPYTVPGSRTGQVEASTLNLIAYRDALAGVCNGTTILPGDVASFDYFSNHQSQLSDGIHPDATGQAALGNLWAAAFFVAVNAASRPTFFEA